MTLDTSSLGAKDGTMKGQVMRNTTERPTKENFVAILLWSKEDWEVIVKYVSKILKAKEDTERQRERTVR
jgi:hypothetical protein